MIWLSVSFCSVSASFVFKSGCWDSCYTTTPIHHQPFSNTPHLFSLNFPYPLPQGTMLLKQIRWLEVLTSPEMEIFFLFWHTTLVMRGWRLYPRALRMIHGSGNKKVHSHYLRVGSIAFKLIICLVIFCPIPTNHMYFNGKCENKKNIKKIAHYRLICQHGSLSNP